jgi:hypothetical protein
VTELARVIYDVPEGTSAATDALLRKLTAYMRSTRSAFGRADATVETVPVPLSAVVWSNAVFRRQTDVTALFSAIIADRRAALLCYGLSALDDETIRYLTAHPAVISELYAHNAGVFAAFAGSLRIRNSEIVLPGGMAAKPLWEAAVGESASRPDRFVRELFSRDDGRVAYLYDALAQFDVPRRTFALGLWIDDAGIRLERFRSLIKAIGQFPGWVVTDRPFTRPPDDPILLLQRISIGPDGVPRPGWRTFWMRALESSDIPDDATRLVGNVRAEGRIDAAWLAESLLATDLPSRAERLDQFAFGLRAFAGADDRALADVLVTVRAFPRYRMLVLTVERMGIANPSVYAAAVRHAARLSTLDAAHGLPALGQFQSAVAVLARLVRVNSLDPASAEALMVSLADLPFSNGAYAGGIARWLERSLAPALGITPKEEFEPALLAALAGVRPGSTTGRTRVAWEQNTYEVDVAAPETRRLTRVLETIHAVPVGLALSLEAATEKLKSSTVTPPEIEAAAFVLTQAQPALQPRKNRAELAARTIRDLSRITAPKDFKKTDQVAASLYELVDDVLAEALMSVVYALDLGDARSTALLSGNVALRHDFGFAEKNESRMRTPWAEPVQQLQPGIPWHVRGSLLGLDLGLSSLALRRTLSGALPGPPTLAAVDKDVFTKTIVLLNESGMHDADRDAIAVAIARGRERVAALATGGDAVDRVAAEVGLDGWRQRAIRWSLNNDPQQVPRFFSLAELLHLGNPQLAGSLAAWGVSSSAYDGCVCTVLLPPGGWMGGIGRSPRGTVATHVPDLNLRVAVALAELKLPATLAKGVLASAMQDYVDRVRPLYPDDWLTLVRSAQAMPIERMQDYVAALTANGPLVPTRSE